MGSVARPANADIGVWNGLAWSVLTMAFLLTTPGTAQRAHQPRTGAPSTYPNPSRVLVIYKSNSADLDGDGVGDSQELATYYAQKRGVPSSNLLALNISVPSFSNFYGSGQYLQFYSEMVSPIKNKLAALGATNIDILLIAGDLPATFYDGANQKLCVDNVLMGLNALGSTATSAAPKGINPYFDQAPIFQPDPGHFDHSKFKYMGADMYLVARLGSDSSLRGMDQVDQSLYADRYLAPHPGYYYGNAYVDSRYGIPYPQTNYGTPYTDAVLSAETAVQQGAYLDSATADMNIAYSEHYVSGSGFPLKWENTTGDLNIGAPGATFNDGTSASTAPRALFYGGWYNYINYNDVYEWLPGSFAIDLNSGPYFGVQALHHGASAASYVVDEPYLDGHQRPNVVYYFLLNGYDFAEAAALSTPYIGWMNMNEGDPLYAPTQPKTLAVDTQVPAASAGYPKLAADPASNNTIMSLMVDNSRGPMVVSVKVEYGADTRYGSVVSSVGYSRVPKVSLPWPPGTYHYRVTLTSPVGIVTTTSDSVYVVAPK